MEESGAAGDGIVELDVAAPIGGWCWVSATAGLAGGQSVAAGNVAAVDQEGACACEVLACRWLAAAGLVEAIAADWATAGHWKMLLLLTRSSFGIPPV